MLKVMMIGNVAAEPKVGTTKDGKNFASFSITPVKSKKDTSEAVWFQVSTYGAMSEIVAKSVYKGSKLVVVGEMVIEKYKDKLGVEKVAYKIMYADVRFLDYKKREEGGKSPEPQTDFGLDDEVPF